MRTKTWNVIDGGHDFEPTSTIVLQCPKCEVEAEMPCHPDPDNPIIATNGIGVIFDRNPSLNAHRVLPEVVKCRYCRSVFTNSPKEEVKS